MHTQAERITENKNLLASKCEPTFHLVDNRSKVVAQRSLKKIVDSSPRVFQSKSFQYMVASQLRRNSQIIQRNPKEAPTIAKGHSYSKHVVDQQEWGNPPMSIASFVTVVSNVMNSPDAEKKLSDGRKAYWKGDTVVIYNPSDPDKGTCFKPSRGKSYYNNLS